jgi:hypothetical protein
MIVSSFIRPGLGLATLSLRALAAIAEQVRAASCDAVAGVCPVCGRPVRTGDPYVRFRGSAYHAEPCAEVHPPAEMAARRSAFGPST